MTWRPTKRQRDFLAIVIEQVATGECLPADWLSAAAKKMPRPPTPEEWSAWRDDEDFWAWWQAKVPWSVGRDRAAIQALEHHYWRGLGQGLARGDSWAYSVYQRDRADEAFAAGATELAGFLRPIESGWRQGGRPGEGAPSTGGEKEEDDET